MMNWIELLSDQRLGREEEIDTRGRSSFQRDYDRVIFCSAFRRMQDKTQVFPLAHIDYVRTRLTHSLEVSCVGRSLGLAIGEEIVKTHQLIKRTVTEFGEIVAAACLAHDIGNPPFGHSGEEAIRNWFRTSSSGREIIKSLESSKQEDFLNFEGNAQGFRIVTRLQHSNNPGGLQLTSATLAAMLKYPRMSALPDSLTGYKGISVKKSGIFASERGSFLQVAKNTGLLCRDKDVFCRHPFAFW